jgi:hypothetical protein
VNAEYDHARIQLVKHIAVLKVSIALMEIGKPVTEFYFGRNGYKGQKEIEANAQFCAKVAFL